MSKIYKVTYRDTGKAHIPNMAVYQEIYDRSVKDSDVFWAEQAERVPTVEYLIQPHNESIPLPITRLCPHKSYSF